MDQTDTLRNLLRIEGRIAIVINALISIGFFFLVFGWRSIGPREFAIDFLPQTAGVSFLGTFVPSLIMFRRIARGGVQAAGPVPSAGRHALTVLGVMTMAVVVLGGGAALLTLAIAPAELTPVAALTIKVIYGGALGWLVTAPVLRAVLGVPMLGR